MEGHELIFLYANTFNTPSYSRLVYDKMIEKYDEFFKKARENADARLTVFMVGKHTHQQIKQVVDFYD